MRTPGTGLGSTAVCTGCRSGRSVSTTTSFAGALWSLGRAVVSHESALSVYDLGDVNPAVIHLTVPPGFAQKHDDHLAIHKDDVPDTDVRGFEGFRVTTPLRTLLDVCRGQCVAGGR